MQGALDGVHVLDLTWNLPGPYATSLLASMGARVTKVEPPGGDPARAQPGLFERLHRGKESVVLDLKIGSDRARLHALIEEADVLVEGFRPGKAAALGCDSASARARNPRLVYCSISAWGQEGPRRDLPAHDLNIQATTGLCHLGRDAAGRPQGLPVPVADLSAASNAASSICAALYARERTGEGVTLDIALADGALSWATLWHAGIDLAATIDLPAAVQPLAERVLLRRLDRERLHALPHYGLFRCADGAWLAIGIVNERHFWRALCEELAMPRMAALSLAARTILGPWLRQRIARRLKRRTRVHWLAQLKTAGIPVSAVLSPQEARRDPHLRARFWPRQGSTDRDPVG